MPWELEVSDRLSGWGFAGKIYRPGVHPVVFSDALTRAVKGAPPGVALYEVDEVAREPRFYSGDGPLTGVLELRDLKNPEKHEYKCKVKDCPATTFVSADALRQHRERYHGHRLGQKTKGKD
jgi:hypothetical protein